MKTINKMKTIVLSILVIFIMIFTSCSKDEGCTDPAANNFDVEATKDDGSCSYDEVVLPVAEHTESNITFNFTHHFDGIPITAANFNQFNFVTANGDTISITKLRYLVSDMRLYKTDGDSVMMGGYNLVDLTNNTGMSYAPGLSELGGFAGIGFNFGFDTTDNAGNYVDLNSASWNWPMMIGGGYHNMQFEGKYKVNGIDSLFAYHNGTASNMGMHEQNHISVKLPGIALNEQNVVIEIKMNLAEWFRTPNTWDLDTYHSALMMNYTAQKLMQANGYNVFTLGAVSQRQR
jgi:hypothetical protein